ncbi:MAG: response regulator [Planctomycetota bacterium]|jgi:DNA-binding NarL/FixJ family response regulator
MSNTTRKKAGKRKILIVDDHPIFRKGLVRLLNEEPDLLICGEVGNTDAALKAIPRFDPNLVIIDISLNDGTDGVKLVKIMQERWPDLHALVFSMHKESHYAEKALSAGARGYLCKDAAPEMVIAAIHKILNGKLYVSEEVLERLLSRVAGGQVLSGDSPLQHLSKRELEVFRSIGHGCTTKQIAEKLSISAKTVDTHKANIKKKLKLRNAISLMKSAMQWLDDSSE